MKQGNEGNQMEVTKKSILGTEKENSNIYLINWSRCANFGYDLMYAKSEQDAFKKHPYSKNTEVNFIITKISRNDLPVIFKQEVA